MKMGTPVFRFVLVVAVAIALGSCANTGQNAATSASATAAAEAQATDAQSSPISADYRIGPQDELQISVFQVPDLSRTVVVDGSGYITFPLIKRVEVGGMTADEAQQVIASKLGKKYLQSPQVSVLVTKSAQRVTVNGAVAKPAVLTASASLTLNQAIAEVGGVSDVANPDRVHVARLVGDRVEDKVYDLKAIQAGKVPDPRLQGGDIVVVESSNAKVAFQNAKDILPFTILATLLH